MADPANFGARVAPISFARIGALRYFDPAGAFAGGLAALLGAPLPKPSQALCLAAPTAGMGERPSAESGVAATNAGSGAGTRAGASQPGIVLLFRSPTETLVLCHSVALFEDLERFTGQRTDVCLVEQTGGIWCCTVSGGRAPDVIVRLGSSRDLPQPGQALTGRLAEVTATLASIHPGEFLILTDRAHADHLGSWMRGTVQDL